MFLMGLKKNSQTAWFVLPIVRYLFAEWPLPQHNMLLHSQMTHLTVQNLHVYAAGIIYNDFFVLNAPVSRS